MARIRAAILATLLAVGATASAAPRDVVLSIPGLDCGDCGREAAEVLRKKKGVTAARFEYATAELHVTAEEGVTDEQLMDWVRTDEVKPVLGAGQGSYLPFAEMPGGADVVHVSRAGEDVPSLDAIAVKGKVTVIDFYAVWCEPCREIDEHMAGLLATRADIAYRKINVVDWDSPVAKRYGKKMAGLPFLVVYGKDGEEVGKVAGLNLKRLDKLIAKGAR